MTGSPSLGLPAQGSSCLPKDAEVQVVDILPVGASRQSLLEATRRQLAEQKRALPITQLEETGDQEAPQSRTSDLMRFTVRDSAGSMRFLLFSDLQPAIGLGARLVLKKGCEMHRDVVIATSNDVVVKAAGPQLTCEQRIWRLERAS